MLYFMNQHNDVKRCNFNELKHRATNLTNWFCPIHRHVYIARHDGTLMSGTCNEIKFSGPKNPWWLLDNLDVDRSEDYYCKFKRGICACGSDMLVPKGRNKDIFNKFLELLRAADLNNLRSGIDDEDIVIAFGHPYIIDSNHLELVLDWGKKCNFDCSYCPPSVHDNHSPFRSIDDVKRLFSLLEIESIQGKKELVITGGEPTLAKTLPELIEVCQTEYVFDKIRINTNGTANKKLYHQLIDNGVIIVVTLHPEFINEKILTKLIELTCELHNNDQKDYIRYKCMGDEMSEFSQWVEKSFNEVFTEDKIFIEHTPIYIRGIHKIENSIDMVKEITKSVKEYQKK